MGARLKTGFNDEAILASFCGTADRGTKLTGCMGMGGPECEFAAVSVH